MKNPVQILANIASGFLVIVTLTIIFILAAPADVLDNWHIATTDIRYNVGDTISLKTNSTKLRKADGIAHRAIECNTGKDSVTAYPLSDSIVKRTPGYNETSTPIIIPENIAPRPTVCRVIITVDYTVYWFRHTTEYAASNDFALN